MAIQDIRGSTADGASGVQVAGGVFENSVVGPTVPWGIPVGNKSTFVEVVRAVTAVDNFSGDMTTGGFAFGTIASGLVDLANCMNIQLRANCSVPNASVVGRIALYDETAATGFLGFANSQFSFVSDGTLRLGNGAGNYVSSLQSPIDVGAARYAKPWVDSISGSWNIYTRPM